MRKTILITGASSGIGKATARRFQAEGWNVIATMRSPERESELTSLDRVLVARLDVLVTTDRKLSHWGSDLDRGGHSWPSLCVSAHSRQALPTAAGLSSLTRALQWPERALPVWRRPGTTRGYGPGPWLGTWLGRRAVARPARSETGRRWWPHRCWP